jgi:protein-disulfide isomerase
MPRDLRAQGVDKLLGVLETDHVLGKADAPNIIIDYFSLTCPHCANFHAAVLPAIKSEWIDTGRLRFVYRHFPSDAVATRGSLLAECGARSSSRRSMRFSNRRSTGSRRPPRKTRW